MNFQLEKQPMLQYKAFDISYQVRPVHQPRPIDNDY